MSVKKNRIEFFGFDFVVCCGRFGAFSFSLFARFGSAFVDVVAVIDGLVVVESMNGLFLLDICTVKTFIKWIHMNI